MPDLDASNLRDWFASAGLLRLISETTDAGTVRWLPSPGRYTLEIDGAPEDLADRCADWVKSHRSAWAFGGLQNVNFGPDDWRRNASEAAEIAATLWCALGSDAVLHRDGKKIQASVLEYGHGGGWQHWLASMRLSLEGTLAATDFARVFRGERNDGMRCAINRWDFACERQHAYMSGNPAATRNAMTQDATLNGLAAIGLASCPSMPGNGRLVSPLVHGRDTLRWPVWTERLRIADLEAALLCGWTWPTMEGRRWAAGKLYCFSRGELREPEASAE